MLGLLLVYGLGGKMGRTADYTIAGFLYQFNKTLQVLLESEDDDQIVIEGINEDIEVYDSEGGIKAIQCKYHESKETFNLSDIYKPIIQMMEHFFDNGNVYKNIEYRLFAHFPSKKVGEEVDLETAQIEEMLESENVKLKTKIDKLKGAIDIELFKQHCTIEFGHSLNDIQDIIKNKLTDLKLGQGDVEALLYPNAIQIISIISTKHEASEREIQRKDFLRQLISIEKVAITKWTMALKNKKQILDLKKKQLKKNLQENSRLRYFIISQNTLDNFSEEIVNFIKGFIDQYHFKYLHDKTPVFCLECDVTLFDEIITRLYSKQIKVNNGFIAPTIFNENRFYDEPMIRLSKGSKIEQREFDIRLLRIDKVSVLNSQKCDDLFVVKQEVVKEIDKEDIEIEYIGLKGINEIKYIMGMRETYE